MNKKQPQFPKIYTFGNITKIFFSVFGVVIICLFLWMMYLGIFGNVKEQEGLWASYYLFFVSIFMIAIIVGGMANIFKEKIIIYKDKLIKLNLFSKKELKFSEIKGYKLFFGMGEIGLDSYTIIPKNKKNKKIIILSFGEFMEAIIFLKNNFRRIY